MELDKKATRKFGIKVFKNKSVKAAVQPKEEKKAEAVKSKPAAKSRRRDFE